MNKLSNGWRVSEEYSVSKQAEYVAKVTKEILAVPRQKIPPTTEQPASTAAAIARQALRHQSEDKEWALRPFDADLDWKRENIERDISPEEFITHKSVQRASKNTAGQSEDSSVDPIKRDKGIHAFTYSKPAELTPEQIKNVTKLEEIVNTPLDPEKPKKPWWKKIFDTREGRRLTKEEFDEYLGK